jgi:preprotein translocase subunit SecG
VIVFGLVALALVVVVVVVHLAGGGMGGMMNHGMPQR